MGLQLFIMNEKEGNLKMKRYFYNLILCVILMYLLFWNIKLSSNIQKNYTLHNFQIKQFQMLVENKIEKEKELKTLVINSNIELQDTKDELSYVRDQLSEINSLVYDFYDVYKKFVVYQLDVNEDQLNINKNQMNLNKELMK